MANSLLFSLILLSLSLSSSSSSALLFSEAIVDAADVLSDSGYLSMALTLQTVLQKLLLQSPTVTVFAPSDSAFVRSGQPPLFLLQYHTLPQRLSLEALKALPYGTSIPTMLLNRSLIVTTSDVDALLSINNVTVNELTVYDGGSVVIYGVDEFFDPSFRIYSNSVPEQCPGRDDFFQQEMSSLADVDRFGEFSDLLKFKGLIKMTNLTANLAVICTPADYNSHPLVTMYSNFGDALPVVKYCSENNKCLIHSSTCEVYGKRVGVFFPKKGVYTTSPALSRVFLETVALGTILWFSVWIG